MIFGIGFLVRDRKLLSLLSDPELLIILKNQKNVTAVRESYVKSERKGFVF